jgi:hypothetical protein
VSENVGSNISKEKIKASHFEVSWKLNFAQENYLHLLWVTLKKICTQRENKTSYSRPWGPGSSVGIATSYGLDGRGIESRWGRDFSAPVQTGPGAYPASCTMGTGSLPRVKSGRGVMLTPYPVLVPWSWKSKAIPLLPLMGRTACTEPQCLYKGDLYLYFFKTFLFKSLVVGWWDTVVEFSRPGASQKSRV